MNQSISIALPTERAYKPKFSPSAKEVLATPLEGRAVRWLKQKKADVLSDTPHSSETTGVKGPRLALPRRSWQHSPACPNPVFCICQKAGLF